jgi:hypothetical protein
MTEKRENLSPQRLLGLAEIYLLDGAPITALSLVREAMNKLDTDLAESEDLGDVSDHLLRRPS